MPETATEEDIWLLAGTFQRHPSGCTAAVVLIIITHTWLRVRAATGDLANYRSLSEIVSVSLPLPINLVFVGFDGDGEHGTWRREAVTLSAFVIAHPRELMCLITQ
jgi:hypothetical protein